MRTNRRTCPTPHTHSPADQQLLGIPRIKHTQTDRPVQHHTLTLSRRPTAFLVLHTHRRTCPTPHTHCLADRHLIGVLGMTHTYTDGPAQYHTLTLSSRPTATRHYSYDTHTQTDGPAQHHTLTLSKRLTTTQHSSYDTHTDRRTCPTHTLTLSSRPTATRHSSYDTHTQTDGPTQHHTHSLQQIDGYWYSSYDTHT